jgi:GNAT superfamily N-acetyltransferase
MNTVEIVTTDITDADALARLIAAAFADVAVRLGLTRESCPGHTSFITADEVRRGMGFGNLYFEAFSGEVPCGTVAIRLPKNGVSTLEKLAVLPDFRHRGIGRQLVERAFDAVRTTGATAVEIGIIAKQTDLRGWYERFGFQATRHAHYDHLPFDVLHMRRTI